MNYMLEGYIIKEVHYTLRDSPACTYTSHTRSSGTVIIWFTISIGPVDRVADQLDLAANLDSSSIRGCDSVTGTHNRFLTYRSK